MKVHISYKIMFYVYLWNIPTDNIIIKSIFHPNLYVNVNRGTVVERKIVNEFIKLRKTKHLRHVVKFRTITPKTAIFFCCCVFLLNLYNIYTHKHTYRSIQTLYWEISIKPIQTHIKVSARTRDWWILYSETVRHKNSSFFF